MKGAEGMATESEAWTGTLEALVESHLKSDGIGTMSADNPLSSGAADEEVHEVISQIVQKFNTVSDMMDKKPKMIAKSAYTLGDQVEMLPCSENSDILVFVQASGQVTTGGRSTMTFFIGGPTDGAAVFVTMADAKTGEILCQMRLQTPAEFIHNVESAFGQHLDEELVNMNIGSARKNAKARGH